MKRDKNLHPLSWDHHAALTSVVFTRKHLRNGVDRERLEQIVREYIHFHRHSLVPHFRHEEEWLLPRFLRHVNHDDLRIVRMLSDHILLHKLMLDLADALLSQEDLQAPLTTLTDTLEAHIRFEERELFPAIESVLTATEMEELGAQLHAETHVSVVIPGGDGCRVQIKTVDSV